MRLIDADELIEIAHRIRLDSRERIEQMIERAPTIEPEQKHGRWVKYKNWYACSECGKEMFFAGTYDESQHYCYNCGARMEESE